MDLKELKAQAYDCIAILEETKAKLGELNNLIANYKQTPKESSEVKNNN